MKNVTSSNLTRSRGIGIVFIALSLGSWLHASVLADDPSAMREKAAERLRPTLTRAEANHDRLVKWLKDASSGPAKAAEKTQDEFATVLADVLNDRRLTLPEAIVVADAIASAANVDGLSKADLAQKKETLLDTLASLRPTPEQKEKIEKTFDKMVADQQKKR
jgi:predicted transcriptional regulator